MRNKWRYFKKQKEKWDKETATKLETTVQCEYCGRKNLIPADKDKRLCSWCHRIVWNNTKAHFIRKMRMLLDKQKKDEENENER